MIQEDPKPSQSTQAQQKPEIPKPQIVDSKPQPEFKPIVPLPTFIRSQFKMEEPKKLLKILSVNSARRIRRCCRKRLRLIRTKSKSNETISGSPIHRRRRQDFGADNDAQFYNAYPARSRNSPLFFAKILAGGYNDHPDNRRLRAFRLYKPYGMSFSRFFAAFLTFSLKPKMYIWRHEEEARVVLTEEPQSQSTMLGQIPGGAKQSWQARGGLKSKKSSVETGSSYRE